MPENYDADINKAIENLRKMGIDPVDLGMNPDDLLNATPTPVATSPDPIILGSDQYEDISSYTDPTQAASEGFDDISLLPENEEKSPEPVQGDDAIDTGSAEVEEDLDFEDLNLLDEDKSSEINFDESISVGNVVTLNPEIADLLDDYDPQDIFKIEAIDGAVATLSKNGKEISELAAIPLNQLNKVNESDYSDHLGIDSNTTEKPIIEHGSKPIRWSPRFIERIRKNTSIAEISKKLEASQKKDAEKSDSKDLPKGSFVSFKTSFYSHGLSLAKSASKQWNKIKKRHERKHNDNSETVDTKNSPISSADKSGVNEAVEWFMNQSKDDQKNFLTDLIEQLNVAKKELTEAAASLSAANTKIEELSTTTTKSIQSDSELMTRVTSLEAENAQIKTDYQLLVEENARLRDEAAKTSVSDNNDNLLARIAELEAENAQMKIENQQLAANNRQHNMDNHTAVQLFHGEDEPELSPRAQAWLEQAEKEKAEQRRLEQEVQEKLKQLNDVTARQSEQFGSPYVPYTEQSFEENKPRTR